MFPSIKEQKPGVDLYSTIFTIQFMISVFLIFKYTVMSADVTNSTDAITYNQFSGQMVIALFLQILIMLLDRFLYKSKTFISVAEKDLVKSSAVEKQKSLLNKQTQIEHSNNNKVIPPLGQLGQQQQ